MIASIMCLRRIFYTSKLKLKMSSDLFSTMVDLVFVLETLVFVGFFFLTFWTSTSSSSILKLPLVMFVKNSKIFSVFLFESEFLMMPKNSPNSIFPLLSSSTASMISYTSSQLSANPSPIKGSSSSSIPIEPDPSSSRELKHSLSFFIWSSVKFKTWLFPCRINQLHSSLTQRIVWFSIISSIHSFFVLNSVPMAIKSSSMSSWLTLFHKSEVFILSI